VIPEDSHVEADSTALPKALATSAMCEDKKEIDIMKNKISSSVDISQIRKILVQTAPVSFSDDASSKFTRQRISMGQAFLGLCNYPLIVLHKGERKGITGTPLCDAGTLKIMMKER